jgi:hypothetical protein
MSGVQVRAAKEAAEPYKQDLLKRGVFLVPLPLEGEIARELPSIEGARKEDAKYARPSDWEETLSTCCLSQSA